VGKILQINNNMTRHLIDRLEFYITNVCNMTCNGCNRFNNYKFTGWQRWQDAEPILTKWADKIDIRHPVILGGEPLLNPDIVKWITGIRKLWPDHSGVQVQSNGTRIDRVPGLATALDPAAGNWLGISIHDPTDRENIFTRVRNFLGPTVTETQNADDPIGSNYQFINADKIKIHAWNSDKFVQSSIIDLPNGAHTLYQSNSDLAHENCTFRRFKNYHMINGKLYKCGPVALMPEFDEQHHFELSDQDRALLNSYRPLTVDECDVRGEEFLRTIDDVIPQCKFCPEKYEYKAITFGIKKIKNI
jgi:organic radical activating enzyme